MIGWTASAVPSGVHLDCLVRQSHLATGHGNFAAPHGMF